MGEKENQGLRRDKGMRLDGSEGPNKKKQEA